MNKKVLQSDGLLLLTSCIWGFAFVAQRVGNKFVGPFTFNGIRFLLGSLSLLPLIFFLSLKNKKSAVGTTGKETKGGAKSVIFASVVSGLCLWFAASLQQIGLLWTTAGNSGFITGIYVVLVPIFGIFLGRKTGIPTWIGALLTLSGLFFVSGVFDFDSINRGDMLTAISGVLWTVHVLLIDSFVKKIDAIKLSCGQFTVCGILSLAAAAAGISTKLGLSGGVEIFSKAFCFASLADVAVPLLYGGICSVGIAYTLQAVAQKTAPPAHASIILCLESVFAALGGVLLLHEKPGTWTVLGFCLMLSGMLATQWDVINPFNHSKDKSHVQS
ncbi:transporter [Spirochaetia bacterium]|nr:transporter [Spirochaetia bacterium]